MKKATLIFAALLAAPFFANAQLIGSEVGATLGRFQDLINTLLPIVVALALLYFFWGLAKFILNSGNEDAKDEGKRIMIWGIIAFFVMSSVWGIVNFVSRASGLGQGGSINLPQVPR